MDNEGTLTIDDKDLIIKQWFDTDGVNLYNLIDLVMKHQTSQAGKTKSKAKAKSSAENGKLGGRPRKQ